MREVQSQKAVNNMFCQLSRQWWYVKVASHTPQEADSCGLYHPLKAELCGVWSHNSKEGCWLSSVCQVCLLSAAHTVHLLSQAHLVLHLPLKTQSPWCKIRDQEWSKYPPGGSSTVRKGSDGKGILLHKHRLNVCFMTETSRGNVAACLSSLSQTGSPNNSNCNKSCHVLTSNPRKFTFVIG